MTCFERATYTFSAIVGQEKMKRALILNAIDPKLGGALIKGEKGTAKSTAVRALAHLLPEIDVIKDCPFGYNPDDRHEMCSSCISRMKDGEKLEVTRRGMKVVDLPINATEDLVVGTLDIEHVIKEGELRPQLLDRFGLCAEIEGIKDVKDRVEVIKRGKSFEENPFAFERAWEREDEIIRERIRVAKELLPQVVLPDDMLELIASCLLH
jgi:Mg-chelatase subunit ChlI